MSHFKIKVWDVSFSVLCRLYNKQMLASLLPECNPLKPNLNHAETKISINARFFKLGLSYIIINTQKSSMRFLFQFTKISLKFVFNFFSAWTCAHHVTYLWPNHNTISLLSLFSRFSDLLNEKHPKTFFSKDFLYIYL